MKQNQDTVIEGLLICSNSQCLSEYPIIDGIPIIVADVRTYVSQNILPIVHRSDFSQPIESLLGDCCGPGSAYDSLRQHLSTYGYNHYGDLDPCENCSTPGLPGSIVGLLNQGMAAIEKVPDGPVIDLGCAVGRSSFELAQRFKRLILGIDLNFEMLKTAAAVLNRNRCTYPKRRVGIVYDRREFSAPMEGADLVDFWVCDAVCLPFGDDTYALAASLNLLDCVQSPYDHLKEMARVLMPEAGALIATPYDWNPNATPVEAWLGGHSQRSPNHGASEAMLQALLAEGKHPQAVKTLEVVSELGAVPWHLRLHDRSSVKYQSHVTVVRKKSA